LHLHLHLHPHHLLVHLLRQAHHIIILTTRAGLFLSTTHSSFHSILQNLPLSDILFALLFFFSLLPFSSIPKVSRAVRVEFARGDGRVKRKEDIRRRNIAPCDTLFVVNFSEATTKKQDLEMLFEPFGELMRIDMRKNYAFVQFRTVEQAAKAKEGTDGGRLQQSIITVEFVVRQRVRDARRDRDGGRGRTPPPSSALSSRPGNNDRARHDDRGVEREGNGRVSSHSDYPPAAADDYRRRLSPPRYNDDYRGGRDRPSRPYRSRSRSRSPERRMYEDYPPPARGRGTGERYAPSPPIRREPSPPRGSHRPRVRSISPPRRGQSPPPPRRGQSPPPPERYHRGGDRDRGYRGGAN
jgi:splicing factor, arginine/serine-rich 4/5/6